MPQKKIESPEELSTGWIVLSYGKPVTVSSALEDHPASYAVNEDIRTWWSAETADAGEYITVDLKEVCSVNALQVNFGEQDAAVFGEWDGVYRYKLEASADGAEWTMLADKSDNAENAPHDYVCLDTVVKARYVRLTNVACPTGKFSISGLRVFGTADKALPGTTCFTTVLRSGQDARTVNLAWHPVEGVVGYNVRYGYAPDKLYLNYTVYGNAFLNINSLSADETYYFTIDVFNEAGVTKGTDVTEVKANNGKVAVK